MWIKLLLQNFQVAEIMFPSSYFILRKYYVSSIFSFLDSLGAHWNNSSSLVCCWIEYGICGAHQNCMPFTCPFDGMRNIFPRACVDITPHSSSTSSQLFEGANKWLLDFVEWGNLTSNFNEEKPYLDLVVGIPSSYDTIKSTILFLNASPSKFLTTCQLS